MALDTGVNRVHYLKTNLWLGIQAGGSVAHTSGVVGGLLNYGYEVNFASMENPIALPDNEALKIMPVHPRNTYVIPREFNHFRHNSYFVESVSPMFDKPAEFIYQRMSLGNYAGVILSRRHGVPLVLEYNGSESWLANNWGTPLTLEKISMRSEDVCLRHAHVVVTVSDVLKDELIERGVEPERIVAYPNGVNTDIFNPDRFSAREIASLRDQYGIAHDSLIVTFVGTFGPWHGAEVFAETILEMAEADQEWLWAHKLHFVFIGDGIRRPVVENLTTAPHIRPHVTIAGLVDQIKTPLHLAASDILVSPHVHNPDGSSFFGSPTKLFEYMASGRPVIASDLNQIGEVLEQCPHVGDLDGDPVKKFPNACGVLAMPEETRELASAIKYVVENPEWRKTMGRNARQRVLKRYTWDHHIEEIIKGVQRAYALDVAQDRPKIRLLFNALHSKSGGGLTYLKNILPLMAEDKEIDLHLCVHEDQRDILLDEQKNITIHYLNFPQGFWRLQIREQIDVPRLARTIGADVTFSPANFGPLLAPNTVLLLRNALSVAYVERRPLKVAYWILVYLMTLTSLIVSRRAISVSEYARSAAASGFISLLGDRFTVVPHGVSEIFSPPKKGAKREKFLLAVSDLYIQKNLKSLIRALTLLKIDHPDITLKIAGHPVDQEYFAELKRTVVRENLADKVEFLGGVSSETLVGYYRRCGVFVFPSTVETFGNPLVEAMACGAPIASSNTAAMPEVVNEAAVFFDPQDVESMAKVIGELLKDPGLRSDLGQKAAQRAKDFTWGETAQRTLAVIKQATFL
jgi:glycosyltransferase involved in cell wall biosynthesis